MPIKRVFLADLPTRRQVIPAENLVAAFSGSDAQLLAATPTCEDACTMLGALEVGTDGVVLRTEDPLQVRQLAQQVAEQAQANSEVLALAPARVVRVEAAGVGDRACVDTCSMLAPGEGLLVGNFARTMFLVRGRRSGNGGSEQQAAVCATMAALLQNSIIPLCRVPFS